jgi:hypothetical protein
MPLIRRCLTLFAFALAIVAAVSAKVQAIDMVVTTIDGEQVAGELNLWQPVVIVIKQPDNMRTLDVKNVLEVRPVEKPKSAEPPASQVQLADGSHFPITELSVANRFAEIMTPLSAEPVKVPAGQLSYVTFEKSAPEMPAETMSDFLIVKKKDSEETETLFGVIYGVTAEQVEFNWDGDPIPVKRTKLAGLGFYQAESNGSVEPICWLSLTSGARLAARAVDRDGENLTITLGDDLKLSVPLSEVVSADYSVDKLSYLSEMTPLAKKWTPLVSLPAAAETIRNFGEPRQNMSFTGSPLSLRWPAGDAGTGERVETYDKGLAIRSRTELEYRIPKAMRRFVALAGIDPETASQGHVAVTIEVDGEGEFDETVAGDQPPREIDIDVTGKQRLRIFVDYGENLDLGDRLHLVEARLIK